jgi:hypothetical protein
MEFEKEEIAFFEAEATSDNKAEFLSIDTGEDEIVFYKLWGDKEAGTIYPHTYIDHQHCKGTIQIRSMKGYKVISCGDCNLRIKIPINIMTIEDLRLYFEGKVEPIENRFGILDL